MSQWCFKHNANSRTSNSRPGQPQWYFPDESGRSSHRRRSRSPTVSQRRGRANSPARGRGRRSGTPPAGSGRRADKLNSREQLNPIYDGRYGPIPTLHDEIPAGCNFSANHERTRAARLHKRAMRYLFRTKVLCVVFLIGISVYTIVVSKTNWLA